MKIWDSAFVLFLPWGIVVHVFDFYDAFGVCVQIFFSQSLSGHSQHKLSILLEVDHLRVSNSNEPVVAVDLESAQVVAAQKGVSDALSAPVGTNGLKLN